MPFAADVWINKYRRLQYRGIFEAGIRGNRASLRSRVYDGPARGQRDAPSTFSVTNVGRRNALQVGRST